MSLHEIILVESLNTNYSDVEMSEEQSLINIWRSRANDKINTAHDTAFYIIMRSCINSYDFFEENLSEDEIEEYAEDSMKYLLQAFTPITNHNKLVNGRKPFDTPKRVLEWFSSKINTRAYVEKFEIEFTTQAYDNFTRIVTKLSTMF